MKIHTTNYETSFIAIADDCPATAGEIPPTKADSKSVANIQFEILKKNPYKFTSDDVLFQVFDQRKDLTENELDHARQDYFSKGQPCFRASPLTKRYGWGIHHNAEGKIAMYGCETVEYENFLNDKNTKVFKAMRSSKS
jgi:hypothetical protein